MSSIAAISTRRFGSCGGLPNSVMSAPPLNARAVPDSTIARSPASPRNSVERLHDPLPQRMAERVHRRIVHCDHRDVAVALHVDHHLLILPS